MTDREKLIELINNAADLCPNELEVITDHLIANGVTFAKDMDVTGKLISLNDRVPKTGEVVLAYSRGYGYEKVKWLGFGWASMLPKNVKVSIAYGQFCFPFWMPLPEPPKEG